MKITRSQLRRIIREQMEDDDDWVGRGPDPNDLQQWDMEADAKMRGEMEAEKSSFLANEQARWEDHWGIDDDTEAEMIEGILSKAYDEIERQWGW